MKKNKSLYYALIGTFTVLYLLIAFVSTLHAISFFQLANIGALAILLGIAYEVGQSTILFSILMTENKNRILSWAMMLLLTALQITANVYASFKFMDTSGNNDWMFWQRSILFAVQADSPEMYKIIISWISGALLPIVALGMTALVADNIQLARQSSKENKIPESVDEIPSNENVILEENEPIENLKNPVLLESPISENPNLPDPDRLEEIIENEVNKRIKEKEENEKALNPKIEIPEDILWEKKNQEVVNEILYDASSSFIDNQEPMESEILQKPYLRKIETGVQETPVIPDFVQPQKDLQKEIEDKKSEKRIKKKKEPIISEPVNKIPGWHLRKEYVDKDFNVFSKGAFVKNDKSKKPTKPPKPKKAPGRELIEG